MVILYDRRALATEPLVYAVKQAKRPISFKQVAITAYAVTLLIFAIVASVRA